MTEGFHVSADAAGYRATIVSMVNMLGAPRACPADGCDGCAVERYEASLDGLQALGYLMQTHVPEKSTPQTAFFAETVEPDPLDAYEAFMAKEIGVQLRPGWKDAK